MSETLADRLKEARKKINNNLKEFVQIEGISYGTLDNWERGTREPSFEYLQLLASKYGVNLHWLITGEKPPEPKEIEIDVERVKCVKIIYK